MSASSLRILIFLIFILSGFLIGQLVLYPPSFNAVDFPSWANDWLHLRCSMSGSDGCPQINKFPFAYLFNSFVATLGDGHPKGWVITLLNIISVIASICFVYWMHGKNRESAVGATIAYVGSLVFTAIPAFYINSGGLEVQFGVLLGIFISTLYALMVRKSECRYTLSLLVLTGFALPLYKDIGIVLMWGACVAALLSLSKPASLNSIIKSAYSSRCTLLVVFLVSIISLTVVFGFNWYRYASVFSVPYVIEARDASPPYSTRLIYLFWIFFSPNGGLLVSWFAALAVMYVILRWKGLRLSRFGVLASTIIVIIGALGFANWWTPFGWEGWGNRLILPIALACLIVISATSSPLNSPLGVVKDYQASSKVSLSSYLITLAGLLFLLSFLYIAVAYSGNRSAYLNYSLWGSDACKAVAHLRDKRPMWEFKKTPVHIQCHFDRFSYIPGFAMDMSPLVSVEKKKYLIHNGNGAGVIGRGWSHVEQDGVWSDGKQAEIRFVPKQDFEKIIVELKPLVFGNLKEQRVVVSYNGLPVVTDVITSPKALEIILPVKFSLGEDSIQKLELDFPDAASPSRLGINDDDRLLAVKLLSVEFQ